MIPLPEPLAADHGRTAIAHSDWELQLVDDATNTAVADLRHDASEFSLTVRLRDQGECSFQIDGRSEVAAQLHELTTDVVVWYGGNPISRQRITNSTDTIDADNHQVDVAAVDYRGLLARRITRQALTFAGTQQLDDVAWQLIDHTQTASVGGNWRITRGLNPTTGTVTGWTVPEAKAIDEAIGDLVAVYPSFDWEINGRLQFDAWSMRGASRDFALEYGTNVTGVRREMSSSNYANAVRTSGAEGLPAQWRQASDLATRAEGRMETQEGNPDLANATAIGQAADAYLWRHGSLAPGYTFTLTPGVWSPADLWLGDLATVVVHSGRLDVVSVERVEQIDIKADADGGSTVEVSFGHLHEDLAHQLRVMPRQLTDLNRR